MEAIDEFFLPIVGGRFSLPCGIPIPGCDISSFMPILVNNCLRERPVDDLFKEEEAEIELLDATVSKLE